jgi:hypothetical protein
MQPKSRTWIVHEREPHGVAEQLVRNALRDERVDRDRLGDDVGDDDNTKDGPE